MQLILRENVDKLGKKGDVVEVRPGFARNFLLPQNLAMEVNDNNLRRMEKHKKLLAVQQVKEREESEALASQISGTKLSFRRKVHGEELYGSVSAADVADALAAKGYSVERRRILLDEFRAREAKFPAFASGTSRAPRVLETSERLRN